MRRPSEKIWILALLACMLLLLIAGVSRFGRRSASGIMSPFMACSRGICTLFSGAWNGLFSGGEYEKIREYEVLLREMEVRMAGVREMAEENSQLRTLLHLPRVEGWKALHAEITMREPALWNWNFKIGLGEADGVAPGAPVLFGNYLAGRVSEVFNRSAMVVTLSNPACRFGVYVISGDVVYPGILCGDGPMSGGVPAAVVDYLPKDAVIKSGATVVTSGLGTELPGGIPVGIVTGDVRIVDDARMAAPVLLGADTGRLKFAAVMRRDGEDGNMQKAQSENQE